MPNRFRQLNAKADTANTIAQINQNFAMIDNENVVKVFKNGTENAIVEGRYMDGRYGNVYYDNTGTPRILIGQAPDDGRPGIWISKAGQNVITLLGG